jgi:hypothetical protein
MGGEVSTEPTAARLALITVYAAAINGKAVAVAQRAAKQLGYLVPCEGDTIAGCLHPAMCELEGWPLPGE